jgi:hypothetical protein
MPFYGSNPEKQAVLLFLNIPLILLRRKKA